MKLRKNLLALFLALALVVSLTACQTRDDIQDDVSEDTSSASEVEQEEEDPQPGTVEEITPDFKEDIEEKFEENEHTIGWLRVPGTFVDEVVVFDPEDTSNEYYLKRDFYGSSDRTGTYYADMTSEFGDGTRNGLGTNTCIYGHALTDDEEHDNFNIKFGSLHSLRFDPEFAKDVPYINFSTAKENMMFEVIALFTANANNPDLPYNMNPEDPADFIKMIHEEVLPRSIYNYEFDELKETDKFITLSTCIYYLPDEAQTYTNYPNTYMRYAVMGRLVDPDAPVKERAELEVNENLHVDNDGPSGYYAPERTESDDEDAA